MNPKIDISPKGLASFLIFAHDCLASDFFSFFQKIFQELPLRNLCLLLKESQIIAIEEWPSNFGGGTPCVQLIVTQILRIFNLPFSRIVIK